MKHFIFIAILSLTSPATIFADPISDIAAAKCTKCHNPTAQFARIDGQSSEYLFQSMMDYKNKLRDGAMMLKRINSFDQATLKGLSDYYASLTRGPAIHGDDKLIAQGKELFENPIPNSGFRTCAECHGKNAEGRGFGNPLNPSLAGQLADFTVSQMQFYKSGMNPEQKEMNEIAKKLTDDQYKALAEYVQSL